MRSRARLFGHAVHPALIVFPLGLLATSVIFDILYLITGDDGYTIASTYMIGAGILAGLLAGLVGLIDWLAVPPGTRARRIGAWHGLGNVGVLALFAVSWLRHSGYGASPGIVALIFSLAGVGLATVTGWLGRELVERLGVGVDPGAGPNAPSSLHGQPIPAAGPAEPGYPTR